MRTGKYCKHKEACDKSAKTEFAIHMKKMFGFKRNCTICAFYTKAIHKID